MAASATRTDTGLALLKTLECGTVVGFNISPGCIHHLTAGYHDDIDSCQGFAASEQLPDEPLGSIANDRVPDFLTRRNTEPRRAHRIGQGEAGHEPAAISSAVIVDPRELRPAAQFHRDEVTERRFRPFARRRFNTMRPFFVDMRTRKP
jgi:hypothetical protein